MANIKIRSDVDNIFVEFNNMSVYAGIIKGLWKKDKILFINEYYNQVSLKFDGSKKTWCVSRTDDATDGTLLIDSINGETPTSNANLYELLEIILA